VAAETLVYESATLPAPSGGTITLRLLLSGAAVRSEIRIDREERLAHKTLKSVVLRVNDETDGLEPLARAMTTVVHELERLHGRGYTLRERAGGGWRGAWRAELIAPDGSRTAASWEIDVRKPRKNLEPLAQTLASVDPARPQFPAAHDSPSLADLMRQHGDEVRRNHAVDALIASDPTAPADELLEELDARGLLDPTDSALDPDGLR
jgi:hypothetical protein